jgi:hypothetical protein
MEATAPQQQLELMKQFRNDMQQFLQAKGELRELSDYAERDRLMFHFDPTTVQTRFDQIMPRYENARHAVARRIVEATAITDECGIASELTIQPPPAFGGRAYKFNLYQSAIEDSLPYDFELPTQKLGDVIDQTIFACERSCQRLLEKQTTPIKDTLRKTPEGIRSIFGWFFPTDKQRATLGWIILIALAAFVLRFLFGVHIEQVGALLLKWFKIDK